MKALLPVVIRAGAVQVMPSVDVERTRSFAAHAVRKRQSDQLAYKVPFESAATEGSEIARIGVLSLAWRSEMLNRLKVVPPSVERNAAIVPESPSSSR